jgi:hypothetical protein
VITFCLPGINMFVRSSFVPSAPLRPLAMALAVALGSATLPTHANDAALKELRQQIDELRS